MSLLSNDLIAMDNPGPFIHNLILNVCILTNYSMSKYNTVLNDSTRFDLAATSDYGVLYGSFDDAAVGDNGILNICSLKILSRAGIVGSGVDWPFRIEQSLSSLDIDQREVCIVITVKVSDRCKVSSVCNTTDIQISKRSCYDLRQSVHGRDLFGFFDEVNEKLFVHDIGIHEDIAFLSTSAVLFDGFDTFLLVQVQDIAVQKRFSCVINGMLQKRNVRTGINMCLKKFTVVCSVYHVSRSDDHIGFMHTLDEFKVFSESCDICIVYIVL